MSCDYSSYFIRYRQSLFENDCLKLEIQEILKYVIDLLITIGTTEKEIRKLFNHLLRGYKNKYT
jgi:hypothetical protein